MRVQEHDRLSPVPHGDMVRHLVHCVPVCTLSVFPMLFTSASNSVNLQEPQKHPRVWYLVFCFFFV
jgi:hypothetical protein